MTLHGATHISVGDDAHNILIRIQGDNEPLASLADLGNDIRKHIVRADSPDIESICGHKVTHFRQQTFAKTASRMETREVGILEMTHFDQSAGQGIAHSQSCRRRKIKRVGFMANGDVQMHRTVSCQQGIGIARYADDGDLALKDQRDETKQFVGIARIRDGHHHVPWCYHSQVAVIAWQQSSSRHDPTCPHRSL